MNLENYKVQDTRRDVSRIANYTILGFLYQFEKTLLDILTAEENATIVVEGTIEDIDKWDAQGNVSATQCKYHPSVDRFSPSAIFGPLLDMMLHFSEHIELGAKYQIFAHFPNHELQCRSISCKEAALALESDNSTFEHKIRAIRDNINSCSEFCRVEDFLERFCAVSTIRFSESIDGLEKRVLEAFENTDLPKDSIDTIYYSNAIQRVAFLSTHSDEQDRTTSKPELLEFLRTKRKTAISRWTLATQARTKLLTSRRSQLSGNLGQNFRDRCVFVAESDIEGFSTEIVRFIKAFVDKFHIHAIHQYPPTFYLDCDTDQFDEICSVLFKAGIRVEDGRVGRSFELSKFVQRYKIPTKARPAEAYFRLRLGCVKMSNEILTILTLDDLYVVGNTDCIILPLEKKSLAEYLRVNNFQELNYLLRLTGKLDE